MKRIHLIMGMLFGVLLLVFALALAQPPDTAGIISGVPSKIGGFLIAAVQLGATALLTFYASKLAGKLKFFDSWMAVLGSGGLSLALLGLTDFALGKFGIESGLSFSWGAFANFLIATAWYHKQKDSQTNPA